MTMFLAFLIGGVVTFGFRSLASVTTVTQRFPQVELWITLVAPSVIACVVVGAVVLDEGRLVTPDPAEVVSVLLAVAVVSRTGNVALALATGLPAFWLASLVVAG